MGEDGQVSYLILPAIMESMTLICQRLDWSCGLNVTSKVRVGSYCLAVLDIWLSGLGIPEACTCTDGCTIERTTICEH